MPRVWLERIDTPDSRLGTIYTEVARLLLGEDGWTRASALHDADLVLGEALGANIPWSRLGAFRPAGMAPLLANYCQGFECLCRKANLVKTLRRHASPSLALLGPAPGGADPRRTQAPAFLPRSFLFYPSRSEQSEDRAFLADEVRHRRDGRSAWIVKPSTSNKGDGLRIFDDVDAVLAHVDAQPARAPPLVVQEYVARPLLLPGGIKFDLRVLALVDSALRGWVYDDLVVRMCSVPYDLDDLDDPFAHLTNHCIQVGSAAYGTTAPTNEMFADGLARFLDARAAAAGLTGPARAQSTLHEGVLPKIDAVVATCVRACRGDFVIPEAAKGWRPTHQSFQLLGFDLLITEDLDIKLLEVNSSPATAAAMLRPFARDLKELAIDRAIDPIAAAELANIPCGTTVHNFRLVTREFGRRGTVRPLPAPVPRALAKSSGPVPTRHPFGRRRPKPLQSLTC